MIRQKEAILKLIETLPDDVSYDEAMFRIYLLRQETLGLPATREDYELMLYHFLVGPDPSPRSSRGEG